ncbi:MAG: PQQ-like domain [Miltoncostaeaceae bacterium]|jgi:outer membrane protein assembly factor BamB|nr:PQQ-like domain [Miltoncostaeaceae bacterium]
MRLALRVALAGLVLPGVAAGSAAGAPLALPGWPVLAPAGSVHPGPTPGGAVVVGVGTPGEDFVVEAHRRDGRRLWRSARTPGCGNCDGGFEPVQRQPDGTYGPIGYTGDDYWSVNSAGAIVRGCAGVVLPDGTCIAAGLAPGGGIDRLRAVRPDGTTSWEQVEPDFTFFPDFGVPPLVAMDDASTVYTSYGQGTIPGGHGQIASARLIAVDAGTGALRWRVQESLSVVAALADGVLARAQEGLVAFNADGTRRWTVAPPAGGAGSLPGILVDRRHGRIYLQVGSRRTARAVALDARTGAVLWRTAPADLARLLSVTDAGLLLVATQRDGLPALRAIGPEGRGRWQFRTLTRVAGAAGLSDGTVALTQGGGPGAGLLVRIDPSRRDPAPRRRSISLSRSTVPGGCASGVGGDPGGAVLRVATPHAARLKVRVLTAAGALLNRGPRPLVLRAPAGRSFVDVLLCSAVKPSRVQVEVTLGRKVTRLPVRVVTNR